MFNHDIQSSNHIDDIFGQDMHAKRVLSLANATLGVIESGSLAIHAIGSRLSPWPTVSNANMRLNRWIACSLTPSSIVWSLFDDWVPYVVGERTEIVVSMDWTEFDADDHSTLVISLQNQTTVAVIRCCGKPIGNRCSKRANAMPMRELLTKLKRRRCQRVSS